MHHWRGPRAFSNRYEGWDSDRAPMVYNFYFKKKKILKNEDQNVKKNYHYYYYFFKPPPIQNDRDIIKPGDKWEFPRHHLKVFNILGEGCFGQVWRCEALNIDGKKF